LFNTRAEELLQAMGGTNEQLKGEVADHIEQRRNTASVLKQLNKKQLTTLQRALTWLTFGIAWIFIVWLGTNKSRVERKISELQHENTPGDALQSGLRDFILVEYRTQMPEMDEHQQKLVVELVEQFVTARFSDIK